MEKIKKYKNLIIIMLIIFGIVYYIFVWVPNKLRYEECLKDVLYKPEKQAYMWKFEFTEEYFKTHDEAMKNCMQAMKKVGL